MCLLCTSTCARCSFPHDRTEPSHLSARLWRVHSACYLKAFRRIRVCIYRHLQERPPVLPVGRQKAMVCQVCKAFCIRTWNVQNVSGWCLKDDDPWYCQCMTSVTTAGAPFSVTAKITPSLPSWAEASLELPAYSTYFIPIAFYPFPEVSLTIGALAKLLSFVLQNGVRPAPVSPFIIREE